MAIPELVSLSSVASFWKENTDLIPVTVWDVDDHFAEYLVVVEVCVLEPHFEIFHIPSHSNRHRNFHPEVVEVI